MDFASLDSKIFGRISPEDLLSLSRVSKQVFAFLSSDDASSIWRASRISTVFHVPDKKKRHSKSVSSADFLHSLMQTNVNDDDDETSDTDGDAGSDANSDIGMPGSSRLEEPGWRAIHMPDCPESLSERDYAFIIWGDKFCRVRSACSSGKFHTKRPSQECGTHRRISLVNYAMGLVLCSPCRKEQ